MCIFVLSKTLMYVLHYNYVRINYGNQAKLFFTDTDSLTYEIQTKDVYQDFWKNKHLFDNSDCPENSPFYDKTNKTVIGKFKDEEAGDREMITEFIGLRSKMYSYVKDNGDRGNNKIAISNTKITKTQCSIVLSEAKIISLAGISLVKFHCHCFHDKRYIHENSMTSYACVHYKIK